MYLNILGRGDRGGRGCVVIGPRGRRSRRRPEGGVRGGGRRLDLKEDFDVEGDMGPGSFEPKSDGVGGDGGRCDESDLFREMKGEMDVLVLVPTPIHVRSESRRALCCGMCRDSIEGREKRSRTRCSGWASCSVDSLIIIRERLNRASRGDIELYVVRLTQRTGFPKYNSGAR